jgi:hypothetical protein
LSGLLCLGGKFDQKIYLRFFFFGPKIGHGNEISKYLERDKKGKT